MFVCLFLRSVSIVAPFPEDWFSDGIVYPKLAWLGNELLSKLAKWSVEQKPSEFKSTLSLISVAKYSKVYQDLKEKYKEMVKVSWNSKCSDRILPFFFLFHNEAASFNKFFFKIFFSEKQLNWNVCFLVLCFGGLFWQMYREYNSSVLGQT